MKAHKDLTEMGSSNSGMQRPMTGRDFSSNPDQVENTVWPGDQYQCPLKNTAGPCDQYQCPMKCEGEKTYDNPGKCPHSGMDLIPAGGGHIFY